MHCSGCCHCREVAVVVRFIQESMYGLSIGAKKVAIVERWPLVEGWLNVTHYIYLQFCRHPARANAEAYRWVFSGAKYYPGPETKFFRWHFLPYVQLPIPWTMASKNKRIIMVFFKGQMNQKIDIFSFVTLPSPNTKKNHPNWDLGKDFCSQAFIER